MKQNTQFWLAKCQECQQTGTKLSKEENLQLRDFIVNNADFAKDFFYKILKPMASGYAFKIKKSYGVAVPEADIATIIYLECYSNSWAKMEVYKGECSLFGWISAIAAQAVLAQVAELGYIVKRSVEDAKNYNLTLKSIRNIEEVEMVIDLIDNQEFHDILAYTYIYRMSDKEIQSMMSIETDAEFKNVLKLAELTLVEVLLAKGEFYVKREDGTVVNLCKMALSKPECKELETVDIDDIENKGIEDDDDVYGISDMLSLKYPGLHWREQFDRLINDTINGIDWNEEKKTIFYERFYTQEDPVRLAARLGRNRKYVDMVYSRLKKELSGVLKEYFTNEKIG